MVELKAWTRASELREAERSGRRQLEARSDSRGSRRSLEATRRPPTRDGCQPSLPPPRPPTSTVSPPTCSTRAHRAPRLTRATRTALARSLRPVRPSSPRPPISPGRSPSSTRSGHELTLPHARSVWHARLAHSLPPPHVRLSSSSLPSPRPRRELTRVSSPSLSLSALQVALHGRRCPHLLRCRQDAECHARG